MAIKAIEGFDLYPNNAAVTTRSGFLQWFGNAELGPGRYGGQSINVLSSLRGSLADIFDTGFMGYALFLKGGHTFYTFDTHTGDRLFNVSFNTDGSIAYSVPGRTPTYSTNNFFPVNSWIYVEISWKYTQLTGVRVNGFDIFKVSSDPTPQVQGAPTLNGIGFQSPVGDLFDDIYLADGVATPGPNPGNAFQGDHHVYTLFPSAAAVSGWTPSDPSKANWQQVVTADGDTSYNFTATVGAEDLFVMDSLPANVSDIIAVQVTGSYRRSQGANLTLTQRLNSGGTEAVGNSPISPYALSDTYIFYSDIWPLDPHINGPWQPAALSQGVIKVGYVLQAGTP